MKEGDHIDVYKDDKVWCTDVVVNRVTKHGFVRFFHQGMDGDVWTDGNDCKLIEDETNKQEKSLQNKSTAQA